MGPWEGEGGGINKQTRDTHFFVIHGGLTDLLDVQLMLWFFLKFALKIQDFDSNICASGEKWSNFANLFKFDEIWREFEICEIYWVSRQIIEESAIVQSRRGTI